MRHLLHTALATVVTASLLTSCVSSGKFKRSQAELQSARNDSARLAGQVSDLQGNVGQLKQQVGDLNKQVADLNNKAGQLSSDVANKNSELGNKQRQLERLQALMDQQKRATNEIRQKMADALTGFKSSELTVSVKNGKVYVSLQENLLFPSGSAVVNPKGKEALGKLAEVLNVNPDITVNIEGHTDSIPIRGRYKDNWDLSTARAGSIVRILTEDYKVDPTRVIASGHSQYDPVQTNSTTEGRALNRRTEIILSPKLDELYRLLGTGTSEGGSGQ